MAMHAPWHDGDPDELDAFIEEESRQDPMFAGAYCDALERADLIHHLVRLRKNRGLRQNDVALRMKTTQSAVSDLERSGTDVHLSTLQRYARAIGSRVSFKVDQPEPVLLEPDRLVVLSGGVGAGVWHTSWNLRASVQARPHSRSLT